MTINQIYLKVVEKNRTQLTSNQIATVF